MGRQSFMVRAFRELEPGERREGTKIFDLLLLSKWPRRYWVSVVKFPPKQIPRKDLNASSIWEVISGNTSRVGKWDGEGKKVNTGYPLWATGVPSHCGTCQTATLSERQRRERQGSCRHLQCVGTLRLKESPQGRITGVCRGRLSMNWKIQRQERYQQQLLPGTPWGPLNAVSFKKQLQLSSCIDENRPANLSRYPHTTVGFLHSNLSHTG